jgi:hypothetical protein
LLGTSTFKLVNENMFLLSGVLDAIT